MPTSERAYDRALRRGLKLLTTFGTDIRDVRLASALSQNEVGRAVRMSHAKVSRIESGKSLALALVDAVLLADAVGLDLSVKTYPGRSPTRDAAHARRLQSLLAHVRGSLRFRTEVPLPARDGAVERRAWDALFFDESGQTGVELEQRLYDVQSQTRRVLLKWRDSGVERLLLVIADTRGNRRVLAEFPDYFQQMPRLKTSHVVSLLEAGTRPPTGMILL